VFPQGYPIGRVSEIVRDEGQPFAQVKATPLAKLDRIKYLLLLWPQELAPEQAISSEQINQGLEVKLER
jgi:rod shape-determining protein MreC